jgi:hypothetical protein
MKTQISKYTAIFLFILIGLNVKAQDSLNNRKPYEISIKEAIDKGMLDIRINGAYDPRSFYDEIDRNGVHYGKCMLINFKSKIDSTILLHLDCGTQLIPIDSNVQTMIVTQKVIFPLYPLYEFSSRFYAMCGQLHDAAPTIETTFRIGELADTGLVKLANYLSDNYMQNMPGQHAMWAYTDQANFNELIKYGADSLSIAKTKQILYDLNLETTLTPKMAAAQIEDSNEVSINRYYIYAGLGLLGIFAFTVLILMIKNKKDLLT